MQASPWASGGTELPHVAIDDPGSTILAAADLIAERTDSDFMVR